MGDFFVSLAGVTAQRFVAGLIWDTLGKDVHQFLPFGCCGNGHLSIGGDVFLDSADNGIMYADRSIIFLEIGIESSLAVVLVIDQ